MRFLTMEAMFLRGVDVDVEVSPLLSEPLETTENTPDDFFLRRPFGFLPSSSVECRSIGAASPSLSDLGSSLNKAGSRLTLCARARLREEPSVSGDVSKASARWRSGIRMVVVLLGKSAEGFRSGDSQSDGVIKSGEGDFSEVEGWSRGEDPGRSGMVSWIKSKSSSRFNA